MHTKFFLIFLLENTIRCHYQQIDWNLVYLSYLWFWLWFTVAFVIREKNERHKSDIISIWYFFLRTLSILCLFSHFSIFSGIYYRTSVFVWFCACMHWTDFIQTINRFILLCNVFWVWIDFCVDIEFIFSTCSSFWTIFLSFYLHRSYKH